MHTVKKSWMNLTQVVSITIAAVFITGCASTANKPQKYDTAKAQSENQATVVIGTRNVSYFDLHRYGDVAAAPAQIPAQGQDDKSAVIQENALHLSGNSQIACNDNQNSNSNTQNSASKAESADPMQTDYTDSSFNLKRLFDSSQPSNLGEAIREDQKKKPKDKDSNSVKPNCESPCSTSSKSISTTTAAQTTKVTPTTATVTEYRIHKPTIFFSVFNYSKATYHLEPGIYYISFAFYEQKSNVHFTRLPGIKNGVIQYGAFEVKAGDVLYFGDIDFDWINMDKPKMITITNNFNEVKKDLINSGNRDLAVKITQAKFYPSGSKIIETECGESLIIG